MRAIFEHSRGSIYYTEIQISAINTICEINTQKKTIEFFCRSYDNKPNGHAISSLQEHEFDMETIDHKNVVLVNAPLLFKLVARARVPNEFKDKMTNNLYEKSCSIFGAEGEESPSPTKTARCHMLNPFSYKAIGEDPISKKASAHPTASKRPRQSTARSRSLTATTALSSARTTTTAPPKSPTLLSRNIAALGAAMGHLSNTRPISPPTEEQELESLCESWRKDLGM